MAEHRARGVDQAEAGQPCPVDRRRFHAEGEQGVDDPEVPEHARQRPVSRRVEVRVLDEHVPTTSAHGGPVAQPAPQLAAPTEHEGLAHQRPGVRGQLELQGPGHVGTVGDDERLPRPAERRALGHPYPHRPGGGLPPSVVGHGAGDVGELEGDAGSHLHLQLDRVAAEQQGVRGQQPDPAPVVRAVQRLGSEQAAAQPGAEPAVLARDRDDRGPRRRRLRSHGQAQCWWASPCGSLPSWRCGAIGPGSPGTR